MGKPVVIASLLLTWRLQVWPFKLLHVSRVCSGAREWIVVTLTYILVLHRVTIFILEHVK
jgi:hypothetical protein